MADTFTTNLLLTLMANGEHNNTWGVVENTNNTTIDAKLGSHTSISTTGGTTTLNATQEVVGIISISGALVSDATIIFSGRPGFWIIYNGTTNNYTVFLNVTGQTATHVKKSEQCLIWCDGTSLGKIVGSANRLQPIVLTDAGTVVADGRWADNFALVAGGSRTINLINTEPGQKILFFHLASGGNFTPVFSSPAVSFPTGISLTATLNGHWDAIGIFNLDGSAFTCLGINKNVFG